MSAHYLELKRYESGRIQHTETITPRAYALFFNGHIIARASHSGYKGILDKAQLARSILVLADIPYEHHFQARTKGEGETIDNYGNPTGIPLSYQREMGWIK